MSDINVVSRSQQIGINPPSSIGVISRTQKIIVSSPSSVSVINAGPSGPQGQIGPQGESGESDDALMALHLIDPTPHSAYDDLPSMTLLFENGLI